VPVPKQHIAANWAVSRSQKDRADFLPFTREEWPFLVPKFSIADAISPINYLRAFAAAEIRDERVIRHVRMMDVKIRLQFLEGVNGRASSVRWTNEDTRTAQMVAHRLEYSVNVKNPIRPKLWPWVKKELPDAALGNRHGCGKPVVVLLLEHVKRSADLFHIARANGPLRALTCAFKRGQKQGRKDRDDRDDDKQLNQSKGAILPFGATLHQWTSGSDRLHSDQSYSYNSVPRVHSI
jgi:hypothetical protein